ncbi:MAG: site-2 protease family protein, partial [Acidobacteria bacterium]|nr:site-2 protease family protein [Acidobacteriota bacterium]
EPIVITVERAGSRRDIRVTPVRRNQIGWIGIGISDQVKIIDPGPLQAIVMSVQRNVQYSGLIFKTIWGLVTQETSPRQLMGPVAIAQLSGESAQAGLIALFSLMASISLNLGLLNLLPIPVLDGGHIAILALEGLTRRDFSTRLKEKMLLAGFVLLMMLMVTVIYNDLTRVTWIERLMPWRR